MLKIDNPIHVQVWFNNKTMKQSNQPSIEDAQDWVASTVRDFILANPSTTKYQVFYGMFTETETFERSWIKTKAKVSEPIPLSKADAVEI